MSKESAEHHRQAAEHHQQASQYHLTAAQHYDLGELDKAGHHAQLARTQHLQAEHHAEEATKHAQIHWAENKGQLFWFVGSAQL